MGLFSWFKKREKKELYDFNDKELEAKTIASVAAIVFDRLLGYDKEVRTKFYDELFKKSIAMTYIAREMLVPLEQYRSELVSFVNEKLNEFDERMFQKNLKDLDRQNFSKCGFGNNFKIA